MSSFAQFYLGAHDQALRAEFARLYVLREAIYASNLAFIHAVQRTCITVYRDSRLYTKKDHWCLLVSLPRKLIDIVRTGGLYELSDGLEFVSV